MTHRISGKLHLSDIRLSCKFTIRHIPNNGAVFSVFFYIYLFLEDILCVSLIKFLIKVYIYAKERFGQINATSKNKKRSNLFYTCCCGEWRDPSLRLSAEAAQKCRSGGEPLATVSDSTGSGIEARTSRTASDVVVTTTLSGRFNMVEAD